jgi:hypothetical protein
MEEAQMERARTGLALCRAMKKRGIAGGAERRDFRFKRGREISPDWRPEAGAEETG